MARPIKEGLDYFPFDVDFHNDEKIEVINGEFGVKGEVIAIRLLCAIYRDGYFIKWSEALKYKLAKQTNLSPNLISEVVTRLVRWGFFDKDLFNSSDILTSRGIQKRYQQITKRRKIETNTYWILAENEFLQHNVTKTRVNVTETIVNPELTKQRKVKETKGKKRKEEEGAPKNLSRNLANKKTKAASSSSSSLSPPVKSSNVIDVSDLFPEHEPPRPKVIAGDDGALYELLRKALGKISVSPEEIMIGQQLLDAQCTFEDIETARKEKKKNNLKYLRNIVCEVRDRRLARKEAEEFEPEIY